MKLRQPAEYIHLIPSALPLDVQRKPSAERLPVSLAVLRTLTYSDVFDFPLSPEEIHRYLEVGGVSLESVAAAAIWLSEQYGVLCRNRDLFALAGREHLFDLRQRRTTVSERQRQHARFWGRLIWALPFMRMVAVTGALAVGNAEEGDDIDFLLITAPGRVWTARALTIVLCRIASLRDVRLCPNYLLSTDALQFEDRNLYAAREIAQMAPLYGDTSLEKLLLENSWYLQFLPNAGIRPIAIHDRRHPLLGALKRIGEVILGSMLGDMFERWERTRKIRKLTHESGGSIETLYDEHRCKGHRDGHAQKVLWAFNERLTAMEDAVSER